MSIDHITGGGGGGLGSESVGTTRYSSGSFVDFSRLPITETRRTAQHCGPTAAVAVVSRDPTFAPRTPAPSPANNRRVHLSLVCPRRGLVTGACVREGDKCPVPAPTTADHTQPIATPATKYVNALHLRSYKYRYTSSQSRTCITHFSNLHYDQSTVISSIFSLIPLICAR